VAADTADITARISAVARAGFMSITSRVV
jgi:hypothetical protein